MPNNIFENESALVQVPSGNKPLPEPMLHQSYIVFVRH